MRALSRFRSWLRSIVRRSHLEHEMENELHFHLTEHVEDLIRAGMTPTEAARRARIEFGTIEGRKDEMRESLGLRLFDELRADLRYAWCQFRRSPGFVFVAVVSLAVGIGANTLVFSVVNALVLAPIQADRPDRLVFLQRADTSDIGHSFPNYLDLRDRNTGFDSLFGYRMSDMNVEWDAGPSHVWGYLATGNYFEALGVRPAAGRFFRPDEDKIGAVAPLAVLSYEAWQSHFSRNSSAIGSVIRINRQPFTIIGIAPAGFHGTELFINPEIWVPMTMQPAIEPGSPWMESRRANNVWVAGRLRADTTTIAAEANLNAVAAELSREHPDINGGFTLRLTRPGLLGDILRAPVEAFTLGVLGFAALVLLTACANLASTLAARSADRHREIAIRLSLGAGRGRIIRQLLTETILLALVGGLAGSAVAVVGSIALSRWRLQVDLPLQVDVALDIRVFAFAFVTSVVAGIAFGLAPARYASRTDPNASLKGDGGLPGRRLALRDILVSIQVAICVVVTAASLLSLQGLRQALTMPIGYEPAGVNMVEFDLSLAGYTIDRGGAVQRQILEAVRALPGVESAAYASSFPLFLDHSTNTTFSEEASGRPGEGRDVEHYSVSPDFFRTLAIPIKRGRDLDGRDTGDSARVAVINETFARQILGSPDPIGRRFRYGRRGELIEVVGVVGDGKYWTLTEQPKPAVFDPELQIPNLSSILLVRSSVPSSVMVAAIRKTIAALDPALSLTSAGTVEQAIGITLLPNRAAAIALSVFALLAVVLVATGIHGVVAYAVTRRRREIAIRVAIGASAVDVLRVVFGRMAVLIALGTVVGLTLALAMGPVLTRVVYLASPRDVTALGGVCALIVLVGLASCWGPARRSIGVEPMRALRSE